jgi:hypothetical protein
MRKKSNLELTQDLLKEYLHYDANTGIFIWIKSMSNGVHIGDIAGCLHRNGYIYIGLIGKLHRSHKLAWLYNYGNLPEFNIDHIDGNKNNNRIDNLREATYSENAFNVGTFISNTSGFKGVSWHKQRKKWNVRAKLNGKYKFLGLFDNIEIAAETYKNFCQQNHGNFLHKNN